MLVSMSIFALVFRPKQLSIGGGERACTLSVTMRWSYGAKIAKYLWNCRNNFAQGCSLRIISPHYLFQLEAKLFYQRAEKVVSDSPGLVDFAIGLVNSVFNLPDGQVMFFEEFE